MLPRVIITRSYCSPAGLLPSLSWRGSGQGQTGRAGRAETEYYHWGESCFMLLCRRLAGQLAAPSPSGNDPPLENLLWTSGTSLNLLAQHRACFKDFTHLCHSRISLDLNQITLPPRFPSMAIERSISHFTASYTFLCHSQLALHSNGKLAQQRRLQGSCLSLPLTNTYTQTHAYSADSVCTGAAWRLTGALCSSVSRPLGPEDTFSQRASFPERRDSHGSEILMPKGHLEYADLLTPPPSLLEEGTVIKMKEGVVEWGKASFTGDVLVELSRTLLEKEKFSSSFFNGKKNLKNAAEDR